jgi:hypothetical protein
MRFWDAGHGSHACLRGSLSDCRLAMDVRTGLALALATALVPVLEPILPPRLLLELVQVLVPVQLAPLPPTMIAIEPRPSL